MYVFPSRYDATSSDTGEAVPIMRLEYVPTGKRSWSVWLPNHAHRREFPYLRDLEDYCGDHGYRVGKRVA